MRTPEAQARLAVSLMVRAVVHERTRPRGTLREALWPLVVCVWVAGGLEAAASPSTEPSAQEEATSSYRRISVTDRDGCVATITPLPDKAPPAWARDVDQQRATWGPASNEPFFATPIPFVIPPPPGSGEPFHSHNHNPSITWLPNGDLLVVWFSTVREEGTEMTVLASRLRAGRRAWDPAAEFFKAANRNMTGSSISCDEQTGLLHHLNGMGPDGVEGWGVGVMLHRSSQDNGATWSATRPASPGARYEPRNKPIAGLVRMRNGTLVQLCDTNDKGDGNSIPHVSLDEGRTWNLPEGEIRGIHAGVAELTDGRWLAYGRGRDIDGRIAKSISQDLGKSWQYSAGPFPGIAGAQRFVLQRLRDGSLLLITFTGARDDATGLTFTGAGGEEFKGCGMFAALSEDEGRTWPVRKLLTPGTDAFEVGPHFGAKVKRPPVVKTTPHQAEAEGYLSATQTPDGVIHLVSSRLYYRFNAAFLQAGTKGHR